MNYDDHETSTAVTDEKDDEDGDEDDDEGWTTRVGRRVRLDSEGWTTKATTANTMITRTMATEATKPRITAAADEDDD